MLVRRFDGTPAAGMRVVAGGQGATTDERGGAVFEELPPGTYAAEVRDPDFVWFENEITLEGGESRSITLREPAGWTARAVLVDSRGRPIPFARVAVDPRAPVDYLRIENGVQDLALWTDADGEIRLPCMHRGPAKLTFRYGSREVSTTLDERAAAALVRLPPAAR